MPFSPFHFGPAILIGLVLLKKLDFPTFIAANIIVDWRAALVFLGYWPGPRHSWVHSYLGASIFALLLALAMIKIRPLIDPLVRQFQIKQEISRAKIFSAAFLGIMIHVTLDAFHHPTMQPFLPLEFKPLYGMLSTVEVTLFAFACMLISFTIYLFYLYRSVDLKELF